MLSIFNAKINGYRRNESVLIADQKKKRYYTPSFPMEGYSMLEVSMLKKGMEGNVSMPRRLWSRQALNLTTKKHMKKTRNPFTNLP